MTCFFFLSLVLVFCPKFLLFTPQQRCQVQAPSRMAKELRWWLCVLTSHWWPFACVSSEPFLSFSSCFLAHVHHTFIKGCILDILVGTWFDDVQSNMIYIRMLIKFILVSMLERKLVKRQKNKTQSNHWWGDNPGSWSFCWWLQGPASMWILYLWAILLRSLEIDTKGEDPKACDAHQTCKQGPQLVVNQIEI